MATLFGLSPVSWSLAGADKFRRNSASQACTKRTDPLSEIAVITNNINEECACTSINA
jgi:hypothetical protein